MSSSCNPCALGRYNPYFEFVIHLMGIIQYIVYCIVEHNAGIGLGSCLPLVDYNLGPCSSQAQFHAYKLAWRFFSQYIYHLA